MTAANTNYVPYSDSVEVQQPDEAELIEKIAASIGAVAQKVAETHDHAKRAEHSKSHGLLKGTLSIYGGLPEHLAQGLFARERSYPVIVRLSSAPGDILKDSFSAPKGMAVKVIGVEGRKILAGHEHETTQDFLMVNAPAIPFGDVAVYWKQQQVIAKHFDDPEALRQAVSNVAQTVNRALVAVGVGENLSLSGLGQTPRHILGETFYSMAALRYGRYIAKICAAPVSETLRPLTGMHVDLTHNHNMQRDLIRDFFQHNEAEYELRAQLCTDLQTMPVENASVVWPEAESPYLPIAKLTFPPQNSFSAERKAYVEELLNFNPWHALPEHRPLGSIMRSRARAYEVSTSLRHAANARPGLEPQNIGEIPD